VRSARRTPLLAAALAALAPGALLAQRSGYTYLSYVGPDVSLVSPAEEDSAARANTPVLSGDLLVTGSSSRAEAILADGAIVRLDLRTELRFERMNHTYESDDDRTVLRLLRGSAAVDVREVTTRERAFRLDTEDATVLSSSRASFRVDAGRRGTEVYVVSGSVELNARGGRALVKAGEYAFAAGDDDIDVEPSDLPRDRFTRFVQERRARGEESDVARYVGADYAYDAADLDAAGSWSYVPSAGAWGWRPNVEPGWTPYALGSWRTTPAGLTWASNETWGWLPYHYGTWVWDDALGWIWIPADVYSPAWVYWGYGPDWTGWCPVGWAGGPWYDTYARSTRVTRGSERGGPWLPNLRGKVEVTQIDRRGWNFVPTSRLGTRLVPGRDVTRGDRIPFPRGTTLVVATAPLRVERGSSPAQTVQDVLRRTASGDAKGGGGLSEGLTSILRRDRTLDAAGRDELRRSMTPSRELVAGTGTLDEVRPRTRGDAWRDSGSAPRTGTAAAQPVRGRTDDGWRASAGSPGRVERRDADRRDRLGDTGWRAPSSRVLERPVVRREPSSPPREAPRHEPVHAPAAPASPGPAHASPPPAAAPAPSVDHAPARRDR
jgi:hypothetical protein